MYTKRYTRNGFLIIEFPVEKFKLLYWDRYKNSAQYSNCFNAGFFAPYAEIVNGVKQPFTMPVANICVDSSVGIPALGKKYLNEWTRDTGLLYGKVKLSCYQNGAPDYHKNAVSTLVISNSNTAKIVDINALPVDCKYAISGVPCIRGGEDVSWKDYVAPQGWGGGVMYATYRNWLGTGEDKMFLISGRTYASNYIYGMEFYNKVKNLGIKDCIGLDGGGSYFLRLDGKNVKRTLENRRINSIGLIW